MNSGFPPTYKDADSIAGPGVIEHVVADPVTQSFPSYSDEYYHLIDLNEQQRSLPSIVILYRRGIINGENLV